MAGYGLRCIKSTLLGLVLVAVFSFTIAKSWALPVQNNFYVYGGGGGGGGQNGVGNGGGGGGAYIGTANQAAGSGGNGVGSNVSTRDGIGGAGGAISGANTADAASNGTDGAAGADGVGGSGIGGNPTAGSAADNGVDATGILGGKGGDATVTLSADQSFNNLYLVGGNGGNGGTGTGTGQPDGGSGGNVTLNGLGHNVIVSGDFILQGGTAGKPLADSSGGKGGSGGATAFVTNNMLFTGTGNQNVKFTEDASTASNNLGYVKYKVDSTGFSGGNTVTVDIAVGTATVSSSVVDFGMLTVSDGTRLELNISSYSQPYTSVKDFYLSGGSSVIADTDLTGILNGANVTISGAGNIIDNNSAQLDLSGKNVQFVVDGTVTQGSALLTINDLLVDNAKVTITIDASAQKGTNFDFVSGTSNLNLGQGIVDIDGYLVDLSGGSGTLLISTHDYMAANSYGQGASAALGLLNAGGDMAAGVLGGGGGAGGGLGVTTFAAARAFSLKFNPGSGNVNSSNYPMVAGLGARALNRLGYTTFGAFTEMGWGSYNSNNGFNSGRVKGHGNNRYYGGGLLFRQDFNGGLYLESAARVGQVELDFYSSQTTGRIRNENSTYYGGHVGAGYKWELWEHGVLDVYGRALWTHMKGQNVKTKADESVQYKDSDSIRSRLGLRYEHNFYEVFTVYGGAAWEYEFDSRIKSTLDHRLKLDTSDLKGHNGAFELGLTLKPSGSKFAVNASFMGVVGEREGLGGSLAFGYVF